MEIINISSVSAEAQHNGENFNGEESISSSSQKKRLLGLIGCGLLVLGVFLPIVSLPIVGGINYIHNGRGDGVIVLALAVTSGLLILAKLFRGLVVTGFLLLAVMCFTLCQFLAIINSVRADMAQSDNIFKGLGEAILATVQIQWGWVPLIIGGFLVLAAGVLRNECYDAKGQSILVDQTKAWATLIITGILMAGIVMVSSLLAPTYLRDVRVPELTSNKSSGINQLLRSNSSASTSNSSSEPRSWQYSENISEMDGKKNASLSLLAVEKLPGLLGEVTPTLHIRCRGGKAELFINTESVLETDVWSNTGKVRIRLDEQQPTAQRWSVSTNHQALFSPNATQLIKQLLTTQTFLFEFRPFDKGSQVAKFHVAGLNAQLGKIAEACPNAKLR